MDLTLLLLCGGDNCLYFWITAVQIKIISHCFSSSHPHWNRIHSKSTVSKIFFVIWLHMYVLLMETSVTPYTDLSWPGLFWYCLWNWHLLFVFCFGLCWLSTWKSVNVSCWTPSHCVYRYCAALMVVNKFYWSVWWLLLCFKGMKLSRVNTVCQNVFISSTGWLCFWWSIKAGVHWIFHETK